MNEIRESKRIYRHQYFDKYKNNMKLSRKGIKGIISIKPGNIETIAHVNDKNGSKLSDPVKIASEFNTYFTNVANSIAKQIPRTPTTPLHYLSNPKLESLLSHHPT